MQRVITYIDGFNLYFGLKTSQWKDLYWLNLKLLAENLLKPGQMLAYTKYFTARITKPVDKRIRQQTFLEAIGTLPDLTTYYGHYLLTDKRCPKCGQWFQEPNEKMTDVSIAVQMMADALDDRYDVALLISADSDLCPPVEKIRNVWPQKRIVVVFPPNRHSVALANVANAHFTLGRAKLKQSVFPNMVKRADGFELYRPKEWI